MKIKSLNSDRFLKRYYPFISLVAFFILASITFSVVLSQDSLDSRSKAAGEVGKVEFVDGNGNPISQTNYPTVNVKLTSPWPVNLNSAYADDAENVLGETTTGNGLLATYYNNKNLSSQVAQRVDSEINFDWGAGSPMSSMSRETFSVRWQGYVRPPSSGTYTFYASSDDGVRVWVGNKLIIDYWKDRGFRESRGSITLYQDVVVPLKVEYYENRGGAAVRLSWSGQDMSKSVIAKDYLYASLPSTVTPTAIPLTATPTVAKLTPTPTVFKPSATPTVYIPTATIAPPTSTVGPTLTTAPTYTNVITLAEDALFTKNKKEITIVNQSPLTTQYSFSDTTPGIKTVYARFTASNGLVQSFSANITLLSTTTMTPTPSENGSALLPWDTTGAGFGPRPASSPYVQCTIAEHESYKVTAPNGRTYATWHPATITRANGQKCAFGHEHGSNPARVPGAHSPYFGHGDHIGEAGPFSYKVKAVELENGRKALFTMHFGTTVPEKAACNPFHWVNLQFVNSAGVLEADISLMADFGEAVRNVDNQPLTPSACPNQAAEGRARGYGARLNPVDNDPRFPVANGEEQPVFYYPWRMDTENNVLGFNDEALTVNTKQVVAHCKDINCNERIIDHSANSQMNHGIWNFWSAGTGWGVVDPKHSTDGVFYTDHFGKKLMNANDPMAVRQYVRPGTNIRLTKLSDQHSYFPVKGSGTYGDWIYRQMANGDPNIAGEHDANADRVDGPDTYAVWGDN